MNQPTGRVSGTKTRVMSIKRHSFGTIDNAFYKEYEAGRVKGDIQTAYKKLNPYRNCKVYGGTIEDLVKRVVTC
jgi:hypothetical protein